MKKLTYKELLVLSGFAHCIDARFLDSAIAYAYRSESAILIIDALFTVEPLIRKDLNRKGVYFFEWSYFTTSHSSVRRLADKEQIEESYLPGLEMLKRFPGPPNNNPQISYLILRESVLSLERLLSHLPHPSLVLSYDIPHSGFDYCLLYCSSLISTPSYYFRSTGLISYAKTLHRANDWKIPGARGPLKLHNSSLPISIKAIKDVFSVFQSRDVASNSLPYSEDKINAIKRLLASRKRDICRDLEANNQAIAYLAGLKRKYTTLTAQRNEHIIGINSIVYFLQREPEASTLPEALPFLSQVSVIKLLRSRLPSHIAIYVKEHPETFVDWETIVWPHICDTSVWRQPKYYDNILDAGACGFLPLKMSSKKILDCKPLAVCTLAGSVYTEALRSGVPCIAHPAASYSRWPGVVNLFSEQLEKEITRAHEIIAECASKQSFAYGEAKSLCEYLYPISLRRDDSAEETIDNVSEQIMDSARQLFSLVSNLKCM
jgi:hypothetical protein